MHRDIHIWGYSSVGHDPATIAWRAKGTGTARWTALCGEIVAREMHKKDRVVPWYNYVRDKQTVTCSACHLIMFQEAAEDSPLYRRITDDDRDY